ncbi:MAG: hypothetical protein RL712_1203 [Bacteroidota bacterium]
MEIFLIHEINSSLNSPHKHQMSHSNINKVTGAGLLITLGIIFGDIGTSPLYVMSAIMGEKPITDTLIYGGLSAVFWTLMLQTTIKYVILTLQADNKQWRRGDFLSIQLIEKTIPLPRGRHHGWRSDAFGRWYHHAPNLGFFCD